MKNIVILLFLVSSLLFAEEIVLNPTDDMYTDVEHPGTTPILTELWTGNYSPANHFERMMLKFDLSTLDGFLVESASLKLTRFFSCPSGGTTATTIHPLSQVWDESSWPVTQHVAYNDNFGYPYVFSGVGGTANIEFEVDVTELVQLWNSDVIDNHGFLILANANNKFSKFYSKEYSNAAFRPELTIYANPTSNDDHVNPSNISYLGNYPNPFNPSTSIEFNLREKANIKLTVYDLKGRRLNTLVDGVKSAGRYSVAWKGIDAKGTILPSGVYLYRIESSNQVVTKKMTLMK